MQPKGATAFGSSMPLNSFLSCIFQPVSGADTIARSEGDAWRLSGFYQDSSLRSTFSLPLEIQCPCKETLAKIIATRCLDVYLDEAGNADGSSTEYAESSDAAAAKSRFSLGVEAKVVLTSGTGEAITALVENVIIKSGSIIDCSIYLDADVSVRVRSEAGRLDPGSVVKISLEVAAVLTEELPVLSQSEAAVESLKALNLGGLPETDLDTQQQRTRWARIGPFDLLVSLAFAMRISARSVPSHTMGQTYVSLTISHSSMHSGTLTVTNIALHPGHSVVRPVEPGARQQVTDMSRLVKWSYAPDCAPSLPLLLEPHESFSTCLVVNATGDSATRSFSSPISATASVGAGAGAVAGPVPSVVAACDVQWTTCRAAVAPADAFRVDLRVAGADGGAVAVGAPLTVELEIANLAPEPRQLMVLFDSGPQAGAAPDRTEPAKSAVVSSQGGHKFGVWGLMDDSEDGYSVLPSAEEAELLSIDVALLLGDVDPGAVKKAEIRFVALREGTLSIPSFKIIDRRRGKWYSAVHSLQVVAQAAA